MGSAGVSFDGAAVAERGPCREGEVSMSRRSRQIALGEYGA